MPPNKNRPLQCCTSAACLPTIATFMWAILSFQSFNQPNLPLWTPCVSFLSIPGGSSGSLPSSWPHDLHQTWNIHQNIWPMNLRKPISLKTNCKWFFIYNVISFSRSPNQSILDLSGVRALVSERCQEFEDSLLGRCTELKLLRKLLEW